MSGARKRAAPRKPKVAPLRSLKVADALEADLLVLERRAPAVARSGLGAAAMALARELDNPKNSATSRAMCSRALLDTLERLWAQAPAEEAHDWLDDLQSRRAARAAGGAKPAG